MKFSVSVVFPEFKTTRGGKEIEEKIAPFEGKLIHTDIWTQDGKDALLVQFDSEMFDLHIHLHNALSRDYIWSYTIRIARLEGQKQEKEDMLAGWKEIIQDDLYKIATNSKGENLVFVEYNGNFGFNIKKEAWEIYENLPDHQVDKKLRELGIDPEKGWH